MSDELRLPCRESENPDDWFLSRDGKQYGDEDLIRYPDDLIADARANGDDRPEEEILAGVRADAKKDALRRRRHAKEACFTECLFRTRCLEIAIRGGIQHGTWGGYYEEEIREIRREIARRKRNRN